MRGVIVHIPGEILHLIRNKMVPSARVGRGLVLKHRAGQTIFEFMAKTGLVVFSAQGILPAPAWHVPVVISGAEGFVTSELLPARGRQRSFGIVYQRRGSFLMIQYLQESYRSLSRPIRRSIAPLRGCRRECRDWHR